MVKKILISTISFIFLLSSIIFADSFSSINQNIFIEENGDVLITETIHATADMGTEWYRVFNDSSLSYEFISVSENGSLLQKQTNWNSSSSLKDKAGKWGILNGELCWGKGQLNVPKTFVLTYKIKNLLKNADGHGIFNHQFISDLAVKYSAVIHAKKPLNDSCVSVWSFGYNSEILFANENLQLNSGNDSIIIIPEVYLRSSDSIIIMLELLDNSVIDINNLVKSSRHLEEIKNTAIEGSSYKNDKKNSLLQGFLLIIGFICLGIYFLLGSFYIFIKNIPNKIANIFMFLFAGFHGGGFFLIGITSISLIFGGIGVLELFGVLFTLRNNAKRAEAWRLFSSQYPEYYRDCPDNLESTYTILTRNKDILKVKDTNYIGALLLELVKNGNLEAEKNNNLETTNLRLVKSPENNVLHKKMYKIIENAAGEDKVLIPGEFNRYASKEYNDIHSFLKEVEETGKNILTNKKYLEKSNVDSPEYFTDEGKKELAKIVGLQKYFKDFTLLDEREIDEVHNWEDMLIYATLLNVAQTIIKRLALVIPEQFKNINKTIYDESIIRSVSTLGRNFTSTAKSAYSQAHKSSSSGGGGSSSFGGGGGHSGGGGGGGR